MALSEFVTEYSPIVVTRDIPALDTFWRKAVQSTIKEKLTTQPDVFGSPLRQSLKGFWKLRVGDYRVVYKTRGRKVAIFAILHRERIYQEMQKRMIV